MDSMEGTESRLMLDAAARAAILTLADGAGAGAGAGAGEGAGEATDESGR